MATIPESLTIVARAAASDTTAIGSIAKYAAKIVKQEVEESVKDLVPTPNSPSPTGLN